MKVQSSIWNRKRVEFDLNSNCTICTGNVISIFIFKNIHKHQTFQTCSAFDLQGFFLWEMPSWKWIRFFVYDHIVVSKIKKKNIRTNKSKREILRLLVVALLSDNPNSRYSVFFAGLFCEKWIRVLRSFWCWRYWKNTVVISFVA